MEGNMVLQSLCPLFGRMDSVCCTAKCLHTPGQGRQREREGSWEGCQLQPEGADGDVVLGLDKCSEWEAPKESSDTEKGWKQGGKEEKVLFAIVCKHQELQSIGKLYLVYMSRFW